MADDKGPGSWVKPKDPRRTQNNDWAFCYLGMAAGFFGFLLLFQSCMEVRMGNVYTVYSGWDMAFSTAFTSEGSMKDLSGPQKYLPFISSILSFIVLMLFIMDRNRNPSFAIEALSLLMMILPILTIIFIDPTTTDSMTRNIGWTNIGMIFVGCICFMSLFMCRRYWTEKE